MASVMSAILLTAATIGLGYSCESQSQINSYSRRVQQTGAKRTEAQGCRGTPVHASAPSASHNGLPHSRCCQAHATYVEIILGKEVSAVTYQGTIKQT